MPAFAVVIVSYQTASLTVRAVRSSLEAGATQVIVVDNASADRTLDRLADIADARVTVIPHELNVGFGMAANEGVATASHPIVILLNSDALLGGAAAEILSGEVDRHEGRAIVGPRLIGADGSVQRSTGLVLGPGSLVARGVGLHRLASGLRSVPALGRLVGGTALWRGYALAVEATKPADVDVMTGACLAMGREAFLELGGFDERFFLYFEDTDLCRRAREAGFAVRYLPDAVVEHVGGASSAEDYHFGPAHARSMRQYLGKWYGPGGAAVALMILGLRAVGFTLAFRPTAGRAWRALAAAARPGVGPP